MTTIRVGHLYPDHLNIYADRGNIAVLARRAAWRGHELEVTPLAMDERIVAGAHDLFYVGGGQDREQLLVAENLAAKADGLREAVADGAALLAVCGGYQLLGRGYRGFHGEEMPGVGLLPLETVAGERRMIGDVLLECELEPGVLRTLAGFGRASTRARNRSVVSSPASGTTARAGSRAAVPAGCSGRTSTGRCSRGTRGSPIGCSPRRSPTGPAESRRSSHRCRTRSRQRRTQSRLPGRAAAAAASSGARRAGPSPPRP